MNSINEPQIKRNGIAMDVTDRLHQLSMRIAAEIVLDTNVNIYRAGEIYRQTMDAIHSMATHELQVAEAERVLAGRKWMALV